MERVNTCYAGLKNGSIVELNAGSQGNVVQTFEPFNPCPIVSMKYVPKSSTGNSMSGLFCTGLSTTCFYEFDERENLRQTHALPFDGKFLPGHFDVDSSYGLVSCRPSPKHNNRIAHNLIEFSKPDGYVSACIVRSFEGGTQSLQLAKSKVIMDRSSIERNAFVFGADEQAKGVMIWETKTGKKVQELKLPTPVLDMEVLESSTEKIRIALLGDKTISVFERTVN